MDFLTFITATNYRLGIDIPEIDYPKLVTLDGTVAYIAMPQNRIRLKGLRKERSEQ